MAAPSHVIPFLSPAGTAAVRGRRAGLLRCPAAAGQAGFFTRLGRLIKEKAKSDVDKLFSGFSKTRENLSVVDELLTYWNLEDTDRVLDELEEVRTRFLISLSLASTLLLSHFEVFALIFSNAGAAGVGLRPQDLLQDRGHPARANPRRHA
jgi:hypothetical protein